MIFLPRGLVSFTAVIIFGMTVLAVNGHQARAAGEAGVWAALRGGGHVALLRHALAPGTGDPAEFAIGDCSTQRNLSDEGRAQARRIGERLRANGITAARVFTSKWCRCRDTAAELGFGAARDLPALNSFFRRTERRAPQTRALKDWLAAQDLSTPVVLVTHQVNISALAGTYAASGELVIVRPDADGEVEVVGRIATQ